MEEGTITKWRKKEGDQIKAGDVLFEVATDKATVEHSALDEGWLRKILIREGQSAIVNQAIAICTEEKNESVEGYEPEGTKPTPQAAVAEVKENEPEAEAQSVAIPSASMQQPAFVPEPPLTGYVFKAVTGEVSGRMPASPLARKLAKEQGLDLSTVKGSGPHGRIMRRDLELAQPAGLAAFGRHQAPTLAPGTYEEETFSPMRKVIAQRLQQSKTFIPHFYCIQEVRMDRVVVMRAELASAGLKVSVNDFVLRATALALKEHPQVNSGFNSVTQSLIRFKTIDIAVAVSLEAGLITPIIRHADYKNIGQLSLEMKALAQRAREGKLAREEYIGGSFTVSNLGMFGISEFSAIINPPQAAILAVAGIEDKPVVEKGSIVAGKVMKLTLSGDHRVLDGAEGAQFLKTLQKWLENPSLLLL
jgi:pyruvate dehydrogenase E2 component (dihydrolipoamide acetyltransferase)